MVENKINGQRKDMSIKRARYIDKNNELLQEFYFAHPETLVKVNSIYNSHFTGCVLWDLFCKESKMVENAWNVSIRKMFDIPRETHRYMIEPLSEIPHIKSLIIKRFLSFIKQLENCPKKLVGNLLRLFKRDVNSTTGRNLKEILNLTDKTNIDDLVASDADLLQYHPIPDHEKWRVPIMKDIISARMHQQQIEGFTFKELDDIVEFVCTS